MEILEIDTKPEHDPYQNIDGIVSRTILKLDPRDRTVWVTQEYLDNSTLMDEWNGLVLTWDVQSHPLESVMRKWIEENLEGLEIICRGFTNHWNGNNRVGMYDLDAHAAIEAIRDELDNDGGPVNYYEHYIAEEWVYDSLDQLTAEMTDEELADLAEQWEPTGDVILVGRQSILDVLKSRRNDLLWEKELEAE